MVQPSLLIIGYVWPEPTSSAAGRRMMQLISFFKKQQYKITFVTACLKSERAFPLEKIGVATKIIKINDNSFDEFLGGLKPDVVIYDRYMIEEQYSWRVADLLPNAINILDTEDLHFLRKQREQEFSTSSKQAIKNSELELRELSSIFRCDLTLVISKVEYDLLIKKGVQPAILLYLPFLEELPHGDRIIPYNERCDCVTIGTFLHAPNMDSVEYLKKEIWPLVRKKKKDAVIKIYGSYPTAKALQLTNIQQGFMVEGWAEDANEVMKRAKLCLAPLRFGAGLKGKFIDAMKNGTPIITTTVGAEAMGDADVWPGFITDDPNEIANKVVLLLSDENLWKACQEKGYKLLEKEFSELAFYPIFKERLFEVKATLPLLRKNNLMGSILKLNLNRSTKYMSKWIEAKNNKSH